MNEVLNINDVHGYLDKETGTVCVLSIDLNKQKYYVMDLEGSLSRSISDSMLFLYESTAESYAGPIEHLVEEKTEEIATIRVIKLPLSRVIPGTWQDDVEEKATKLALDDLSCESIEQLANHLHKALESTLGTSSKTFKELSDDMDKKQKVDLIVLAISIAALLVACGALSVSLYMLNS